MSSNIQAVEVEAVRVWSVYDACAAVEGFDGEDHDEETILSAWQYLVNVGIVWQLQGWSVKMPLGVCGGPEIG